MEGPQWTTGSIGRRCKPGNGLSRPVLIGRHEPPPRTPPPAPPHNRGGTANRGRGGPAASTTQPRTNPPTPPTREGGGPPRGAPQPHPHPGGHSGAGKRPDPYRTRKLSPPAPMVLPPPGSGRAGHHRETHHPTAPPSPPRGRRGHNHPTPHGDDGATTIPQARPGRDTLEPAPPHRPPRPQQPRNETLHGPQQARAGLPRSIGIVPSRLRTSREGAPGGLGLLRRPPLLARRRAGAPPQGRRSPSCGAGARRGPRMAR